MMDESDDDFKELCASFFQRVKKNGTKEVLAEKKTQKTSNSSQIANKLKRTKPAATKSKTLHGPRERKTRSGSQAPRTKKQGAPKWQESEPAPPENGEQSVLASTVLQESARSTQTGNPARNTARTSREENREAAPSSNSQLPPSCLTAMVPSPSKPRAAELVLQRMQQFKRADPERLKHASEGCPLQAALEENVPKGPGEAMTAGNGAGPWLPATESDAAVALALQQEFGQEGASALDNSVEEKGLFFCQICQKNLSAMNVTRREQHVNRCLDEAEKALRPSAPQIPECPICGKPFLTLKSRISHLKQCAVKMEVGPQLLLQAVRLQTAQLEGTCSTLAPAPAPALASSSHTGSLKRKGAPIKKEPQKRRKVNEPEVPSEDLLVAMALSRSEMEQKAVPAVLRLGNAFSERTRLGTEKKSRKKKAPISPPQLLVQDSKTTERQIEDRVAQLFAEEVELSSTPPLPASRLLKEGLEKASRCLRLPEGKQNFLWEGSALTGAWPLESFYTPSLVPPMMPQQLTKGVTQEPTLPPVPPDQPQLRVHTPPALHSAGPRNPSPSASQREHQALQDLMDLAGEGLSASPWPCSGGPASLEGTEGMDLSSSGLPLTGFVLPSEQQHLERGDKASLSLGLLVADFSAMVNNPHLSDVQFQMDSGRVLYAHKFVLYARCPLLMQYVNSEGFFAVEDGDLRTQRVLLSDVSTEATCAFLHYLYTADTGLPPQPAPDLSSLARRFGVSELVHLCEQAPVMMDSESDRWKEKEDEDCESRAENFQELLRSVWVGEEEEAEALLKSEGHQEDREKVNEAEMEEIYEFAATQRKLLQEERAPEIKEETDQLVGEGRGSGRILASIQVPEQSENTEQMESCGQGRDEAPAKWKTARQSVLLPLEGQCSDGEEEAEVPKEALDHSSSSLPQGSRAERKEGPFLYSVGDDEKQPFASTPGGHPEPSQITSDPKEGNGTVGERDVESSRAPTPRQAPILHPCFFPSQPPPGRSPRRPHPRPYRTSGSSPPMPQSQGGASRLASQDSPSKRKRGRSLLALLNDPGCQKGKECGSMLECKNKGILLSPEKSPSIDLTQAKPGHQSSRSQNSPSTVNREDEVILLLDSDEEMELEQTKIKSVFNGPPEEGKVQEVSPTSSELFSIIDIDADQEPSQSSPRREATLQQEEGGSSGNRGSVGDRGTPGRFFDPVGSPYEDSTTDTSWLVPATPLASRSRDSSSQTQITGLRPRASVDHMAQLKPRAPLENKDGADAASKFSVIVPQTSSSCLGPSAPGSPDSRRQTYRSPTSPRPRHHKHFSLPAPCPASGGLAGFSRQFQEHSPPRSSLPNQATASEVVEVEDSDDEQEVASPRVSGTPLLDSNPPIPADDCCWHVEPLSPIPIDHVNLEWTGPLSTSSPGGRVGEAPGSGDCHSPTLLGTTPIRGSCPGGRRKCQEKSPRTGSPGSSGLSFLNLALWDDWDGEEQKSPEVLPLTQTPSADRAQKTEGLEKPSANRRKNLPPKVPITPMPRYSIMETPVLKKELDRFGVRPLPKRQMVLKLKEIFQYTHQTLDSDSEDESQSSQVPLEAPCNQTHATKTSKASRAAGCARLEATSNPIPKRAKGPAKTKAPRHQKQQPGGSIPPLSTSPAEEVPLGPEGEPQLPASQKPTATSADGSDSSFSSQSSSSCEFGVAFESAGEDEEGEEGVSTSQAAVQAGATEEAVRRYIRSTPALYRKVLLYQPFELAELQAELKQQGIRMATGKLLDFLDAHCITFTTAAARKEKLERKRRQPVGKKKGGRARQPIPHSPPMAVSSL
ncbi:structure-specific endonuclease subunit SLX4 isoform X1 [Rhinolophus ferrumequinum]|uniref:structure-specific endonuclease subunit SLX4 isoform X1 n=1 Tax=Rhinolophus ferrumequinum TaxID=59479 RepID=UPI00140F50C9|nr:structure-specific endonuclease subunit SLX4 isoform X1 [Rhinolophus ferrumequinum]XP_032957267.1 structure-specific endonuclease subunit SLX4 isoform X1 [Rhinolophus ferrumequinum]